LFLSSRFIILLSAICLVVVATAAAAGASPQGQQSAMILDERGESNAFPPAEPTPPAQPDTDDALLPEERQATPPPAEPSPDGLPEPEPLPVGALIGDETVYLVKPGDTLKTISSQLGVSSRRLARTNRLDPAKPLLAGQKLRVNTRRIVPRMLDDGIVINIPERTLYQFRNGDLARFFPVALGKATGRLDEDPAAWQTPTGSFVIVSKVKDPTWYVPLSIRREMERKGQEAVRTVPPGKENPLGQYALKTSIPGIMIHGTNRPASIATFSSHGCIRVSPARMERFYQEVPLNTPGEIIYQPVKLALSDAGRVYLEVHHDVYRKLDNLEMEVRNILSRAGLDDRINWRKVRTLLKQQSGIPEDVTL